MKICPNCKTEVKDTAKFCFLCGNRFDAAPTPQSQSSAPETGIGETSLPPPPKDFSLIGPFIHWNILPEQIAVKIDENDIAAYGRDVKGVSIQDGITALFFYNGKLLAQLGAGSYTFKDLGVEEPRASKQPKAESAPKDPKKDKTAEKKKLFGSFINRVTTFFSGRSRERARAAGLTNRIPANIPPVSIVLVRTTDFPLVFTFKNANTAKLRSEIGLYTLCRVADITSFYSRILSGDRKMVSLKDIGQELEPVFIREINMLFAPVSPEQVNNNTDLQRLLLQRLQIAVPQIYPFISIVNIVNLTATNSELEGLRRLREELYVSEQTLEETMRRNVFLSRMAEVANRQDERMLGIDLAHEQTVRRMGNDHTIAKEKMDAALAAAKEKIYEEMSLTEDEKAKFDLMLSAQRKLREARTADEVEAAMQVFEKNGLLRQQEMDNLRHQIAHDASLRDLNDAQVLSIVTLQNQQELEQKRLDWERRNEKDQLDHELEQTRKVDGYHDERFRSDLEKERLRREQDTDLDHEERKKQLEIMRGLMAIRQEKEDAEHRRNLELEKTRAQSQQEITRIYTVMTPEQIMAANPNITPEAAQALSEKFKAEAAAAQNDKSLQLMQQLLQMKQDHAQDLLDAKQQELDRTRADVNANADRFVDGMKTTISAVGGMGQPPPSGRNSSKSVPPEPEGTASRVCPKCNSPADDGAVFCDNCGQRL